jgi:hypothetical protein
MMPKYVMRYSARFSEAMAIREPAGNACSASQRATPPASARTCAWVYGRGWAGSRRSMMAVLSSESAGSLRSPRL